MTSTFYRLRTTDYRLFVLLLLLSPLALSAQDVEEVARAPVFTLNGGINTSAGFYSASGIDDRQSPFTWTISGSLTPTLKTFSFPLTFIISERERSFRQPFNIVGLSPKYRWATLHLGYRSMSFSRYTLGGKQFFGAGLELSPGPVRFSAMYGRFQRAVEEDSTEEFNLPSYAQFGHALKVGIETGTANATLSWVRAKDDTTSLARQVEIPDFTPQENNAFGLELGFTILPELTFDAEGGVSLYTRDLSSPDIDLAETDIPTFLNDIQTLKLSTTLTLAARAGLNLTMPTWGLRLGYERIEPDYRSLGAYYFNTDIENWTIAPNARLGDVRLSGSLGLGRDNLLGQKIAQTNRVIGSFSADWQPSQTFGINTAYSNYSTGQVAGRRALNDTIAVRNVTQSASLAPRFYFQQGQKNHAVSLLASYQDFTDLNAFTQEFSDNSALTGSLSYNITFGGGGNLSLGAGLTASKTTVATGGSNLVGLNLNGGRTFLKNDALSLSATVGISRVSTTGPIDFSSTVLNENLSASYRVTDVDNVTLSAYATQSSAGGAGVDDGFSEISVQVGYGRSFNIVD